MMQLVSPHTRVPSAEDQPHPGSPPPTATVRPTGYLFLDVDGVLNPEAWALDGDWAQRCYGGYYVWTSAELGRWLNHLMDNGTQVVWATTWVQTPDLLGGLAETF